MPHVPRATARVLIISHAEDAHVQAVEAVLGTLGVVPTRLNTETLGTSAMLTVAWHDAVSRSPELVIEAAGLSTNLNEFTSIWFRRPQPPQLMALHSNEQTDLEFAHQQWDAVLNGLYALMGHTLWVSPPESIRTASYKPYQLEVARQVGLRIPRTLITSDSDKARRFYRECKGDVVVKPVGRPWTDAGVIYTNRLRPEDLEHLDELRFAPAIFQELVPKAYEIRATVVGRRVLAIKIDSQKSQHSELDWRRYDIAETPYTAYDLPDAIQKQCLSLASKLRLQFGGIDLIRMPDGRYVFLEINGNGQFLWAEQLSGVRISRELAFLLAGRVARL